MNAPADIALDVMQALPAAWERYLPTVAALCPASVGEEAELRARLMLLADLAADDQRGCSWEAGQALTAIENIAAGHRLTPMPVEMLRATRLALLRFYRAARELEQIFGASGGG